MNLIYCERIRKKKQLNIYLLTWSMWGPPGPGCWLGSGFGGDCRGAQRKKWNRDLVLYIYLSLQRVTHLFVSNKGEVRVGGVGHRRGRGRAQGTRGGEVGSAALLWKSDEEPACELICVTLGLHAEQTPTGSTRT